MESVCCMPMGDLPGPGDGLAVWSVSCMPLVDRPGDGSAVWSVCCMPLVDAPGDGSALWRSVFCMPMCDLPGPGDGLAVWSVCCMPLIDAPGDGSTMWRSVCCILSLYDCIHMIFILDSIDMVLYTFSKMSHQDFSLKQRVESV